MFPQRVFLMNYVGMVWVHWQTKSSTLTGRGFGERGGSATSEIGACVHVPERYLESENLGVPFLGVAKARHTPGILASLGRPSANKNPHMLMVSLL